MKILFTDLDDTLLNKESKVSEYSRSVLRDFVDAGNILVPASGRPLLSIQKCLRTAGIEDLVSYCIAYNGALIWDTKADCEAWAARIPMKYARIIQQTAFDSGIHIQTYMNETVVTPRDDDEIKVYRSKIFIPAVFTPDPLSYIGSDPFKMLAVELKDREKLCRLRDGLDSQIGSEVNMFFSSPMYLEFVSRDAGKGAAVLELCKLLNVPVENTYAAGDQENDISMIQAAGCGIAMLNAVDAAKAAADVITEYDHDHDGLVKFLLTVF